MVNEAEQIIGYSLLGLFCVFGLVICCVPQALISPPPGEGPFQGDQSQAFRGGNPQDGENSFVV